jgi:hypothetical protein
MTVQREALVAALRSSIEVSTSELEGKEEELAGARAEEATLNAVVHGTEAEIAAARSSLEALAPRVDSIVVILDEARGALAALTPSSIGEIKRMRKPPAVIRRTLELVLLMLKVEARPGAREETGISGGIGSGVAEGKVDWEREVLPLLTDKDLGRRLRQFEPRELTKRPAVVEALNKGYLEEAEQGQKLEEDGGVASSRSSPRRGVVGRSNQLPASPAAAPPDALSLEKVKYANKTCGILLSWALHHLRVAATLS